MKATNKKTGPKPIQYIPEPFRGIDGVEQITTPGQLARLRDYLNTSPSRRAPFVRLGASVPPPGSFSERKPNSTYAVMIDGEVSVIHRVQDPRAAHRWMSNPRRPWNMDKAFASGSVR